MSNIRRRRRLTEGELQLWAEVARSVRPLRPTLPLPPAVIPPAAGPQPEKLDRTAAPPAAPAAVPPRPALSPLVPLDRRATRALARGRARAEAVLDLHGLTQAEAHARLIGFLRRAQASGHGLVLVITGQGGPPGAAGERGVLRRNVPHWLRLPELRGLVLGFEQAGPRQGGAGALYVRLRRARAGQP